MPTTLSAPQTIETLADLQARLGSIPLSRIRFRPSPGSAVEKDVVEIHGREKRVCELIDGTLVEKVMGFSESCLAGELLAVLRNFVRPRKLGLIAGADGFMQLSQGLVRIPDVSFVAWENVPGKRMPQKPIPMLAPTLAVEVLSEGNTEQEMERKRGEYFTAGTRLVWILDPVKRTVRVYRSPEEHTFLGEEQTLEGEEVLPGFALPLRDLFAVLDEESPSPPEKPRKRRKGG